MKPIEFGGRLKQLRTKRGLSQRDVARATGIDAVHICRYEADNQFPRWSNLVLIGKYFGVSLDWLITGKEAA